MPPTNQNMEQKYQTTLGLPPGFKTFSPYPFGSMDQQSSRVGMEDKDFYWVENFVRIGSGALRTTYDAGTDLYTSSGGTIIYFFFYNIATTPYCAVFFADGTAIQVNQYTQATTIISSVPNTFYVSTASLPACTQFGSQYLVISNSHTENAYWLWDGSLLYFAGSIGPSVEIIDGGTGYTSPPTITAYNGSGSGLQLTAVVSGGSVVSVTVVNPGTGYQPGDQVLLAFNGGGSTGNSAILNAVLAKGTISAINVTNAGSGYSAAPTVTISGTGTGASAYAVLDANNEVSSIVISNPGSGYTSTPTIIIAPPGGSGQQATAVAVLSSGSVASVTVVNGGTGFSGTPTLQFVGGGGLDAAATATVTNGVITGVSVTNGGSDYTGTPAVVVETAVNNAAAADVALMPYGISGTALETFQSRIWISSPWQPPGVSNGATFLVSAPGSLTDYATSDGGVLYTSSDRFLRANYTLLRQANGYLYPVGDSSVSVISNVQTAGSPTSTTFNYQNTDPQIGTNWRNSCQDYSRTLLFANPLGVYGLYGGAVTKVSDKLDRIFDNAVFPPTAGALTPCSAVVSIYDLKFYLLLLTITDPFTNNPRNVMVAWNERDWFVLSQSRSLTFIGTQEINSNLQAWGTDGTSIFQLLTTPSNSITKTISTKLYGVASNFIIKQSDAMWLQAIDRSVGSTGIAITAAVDYDGNSYTVPEDISFSAVPPLCPIFGCRTGDVYGSTLGLTLTTNSLDFELWNITHGYMDYQALYG